MNFIDVFIILALGYAAWKGFKKGFILELFTFLALFMGLYAGIHFSDYLSKLMISETNHTSYVPVISFILVFLAVGAMVYFAGKALEKVIKVVQLSLVNKLAGIFFSMLKMIFFLGTAIILSEGFDERNDILSDEMKEGSLFFYPVKNTVTAMIPAFDESTLYLKNVLMEHPEVVEEIIVENAEQN